MLRSGLRFVQGPVLGCQTHKKRQVIQGIESIQEDLGHATTRFGSTKIPTTAEGFPWKGQDVNILTWLTTFATRDFRREE